MVCILQLVVCFFYCTTQLYISYFAIFTISSEHCRYQFNMPFQKDQRVESTLQFAIKEVLPEMRARHWFLCAFHISNWDLVRLQNIYIFHNQQVRVLTDWMSRDSQLFFNFQKMSQCLLFSYYHHHHCHLLIYILWKQSKWSIYKQRLQCAIMLSWRRMIQFTLIESNHNDSFRDNKNLS